MRVPPEDRGMLYANLLSLSRVPLAGLLWIAPASAVWVLSVMAVAGLTDVLDGWVVRRTRARRHAAGDVGAYAALGGRGAALDGFADKVFVTSAALALWAAVGVPAWQVAMLAARELLFVPMMLAYRFANPALRERVDFTAQIPGKAATIAQFVALVLGFLRHPLFVEAAFGACALGVFAVGFYLLRALREPEGEK